ncbi:hypothetical protein P7C70_g4740, partial [Phenoliferia sp. Uapishka_3]
MPVKCNFIGPSTFNKLHGPSLAQVFGAEVLEGSVWDIESALNEEVGRMIEVSVGESEIERKGGWGVREKREMMGAGMEVERARRRIWNGMGENESESDGSVKSNIVDFAKLINYNPTTQQRLSNLKWLTHELNQFVILFHAFLTSQSLPKTAKALLKELSAQTPGLGTEIEDESAKCSGSELVVLVRAKLEHEKEK